MQIGGSPNKICEVSGMHGKFHTLTNVNQNLLLIGKALSQNL
jgi:hypothetical protein